MKVNYEDIEIYLIKSDFATPFGNNQWKWSHFEISNEDEAILILYKIY